MPGATVTVVVPDPVTLQAVEDGSRAWTPSKPHLRAMRDHWSWVVIGEPSNGALNSAISGRLPGLQAPDVLLEAGDVLVDAGDCAVAGVAADGGLHGGPADGAGEGDFADDVGVPDPSAELRGDGVADVVVAAVAQHRQVDRGDGERALAGAVRQRLFGGLVHLCVEVDAGGVDAGLVDELLKDEAGEQ